VWKWHSDGAYGREGRGAQGFFGVKFRKEMPGLDEPPFEGHPIGQRIYENVSKEAGRCGSST